MMALRPGEEPPGRAEITNAYNLPCRYEAFLRQCRGKKVLYWELGVGMNTPGIIKYNFWQRVWQDRRAFYACVNLDEAYCPPELAARSACIKGDIGAVLEQL